MEDICRTCTAHIATGVDTSDCLCYAKAIGSGRKVCVDYIEADSCKADRLETELQTQLDLRKKDLDYVGIVVAKNKLLARLMLLVDDSVSNIVVSDTQVRQWAEFIAKFPDEKE